MWEKSGAKEEFGKMIAILGGDGKIEADSGAILKYRDEL